MFHSIEKLNQEIDQERKGQQQQPSSQTTENNETDNTIGKSISMFFFH